MRIDAVNPACIPEYWPHFAPLIEKLCARDGDEYSPQRLADEALEGKVQLWVGTDPDRLELGALALCGTQLEKWSCGLVCRILFVVADEMDDWRKAFGVIKNYSHTENCVKVITQGRKGWAREMGLKPIAYIYEVE